MNSIIPETGNDQPKCLNCDATLYGPYCYACGQKDLPRRQTIRDLLSNFIGSFTSFESKFFRSIRYLLLSPGHLTESFIKGKRELYYHPARMYVFLSFVYFLIFFAKSDFSEVKLDEKTRKAIKKSGISFGFKTYNPPYNTIAEYDSAQEQLSSGERDPWIDRYFNRKAIKLNDQFDKNPEVTVGKLGNNFITTLPKMFFLLLPVFALFLRVLYWRRDFFYAEHLVFSIHFYDFCFLTASAGLLISAIPYLGWITTVLFFLVLVYLFIAMRKVYQQSVGKTLLKFFLLSFSFLVAILIASYVNAIIMITQI